MSDLADTIRELSPERLRIVKQQLPLKLKEMSPMARNILLQRLGGISELADIVGPSPTVRPTQPEPLKPFEAPPSDIALWQKGLHYLTSPFQWAHEKAILPFAATVTAPWSPTVPGTERLPWLERQLTEYEKWQAPWGVKGAVETLPWFALPTAAGVAGRLGSIAAAGGRLARPAALAARAIKPVVTAERAIAYPIAKPLEMVAKKIAPKIAPRLKGAEAIMADLQPFDELIGVATQPDKLRKLANLRGLRGLSGVIAGKAAIAEKPVELAIVGRNMLRYEGGMKATGAMARLEQLGTSSKVFKLTPEGAIPEGPLKGVHLNEIRTYPSKYAKNLTEPQNAWIKTANEIEQAKLDFLQRNNIEINKLAFDEGGQYAGRRVVGKLSAEGELLESGFIGAGPSRVGAKASFEKVRVFNNIDDAVKAGFRYLPEEEALALNTRAAYNRVADKQMTDWLLPKIAWRTSGAPERLKIAASDAQKRLAKAKNISPLINRALRGETLPEVSIRAIEDTFPEIGLRGALGNTKALKALKPKVKDLVKSESSNFHMAEGARARARERALQTKFGEAVVPHPAFAGKILTGSEAQEVATVLRSEFTPGFSQALGAVNQVNAIGRYFALAGDMSPFTIQLIFMAGAYPKQYLKAMGGFVRAMFDPKFHAKYLTEHAATIQGSRNLILTKGGATEFTEAMARGGLLRKQPLKYMGKVLEPFQRGFEASLDVAGVELREALSYMATTPARAAQVEAFINEFRGLANPMRIGVGSTQRQLERVMILAPQYNRAIAALLTDVARGNLRGQLARNAIAKGVTAVAAMTVAVSYALGEDTDDIIEHLNPASPTFMTWQIAGQNIGPGSKVRSLIKTWAQSATNPEDLFKISMENPNLRFARGNLAPTVSTGLDLLLGENFIGDPTRDNLLHATKTVIGENLMPIWVQSVVLEGAEGEEEASGLVTRGLAEFAGMRGYPMSPSQLRNIERDTIAQERYGMNWDDLASPRGPGRLAQVRLEQEYPRLQELTEKAEEAYAERAKGEGKVWNEWRAYGGVIEQRYQQAVGLASREFEQTGDGTTFRQKVNEASSVRGAMYDQRQRDPVYTEIYEYFDEPLDAKALAGMNPQDVARRAYYKLMYGPDIYDEFGNYKFDEADRREGLFIQRYGQEALDYVQDYMGARWDEPQPLKMLREAQKLLEPYWEIEDAVWTQYGAELRKIAEQISIVERTDPGRAKKLLRMYPQIVFARRLIVMQRKQMKRFNPAIAQALNLFYRY